MECPCSKHVDLLCVCVIVLILIILAMGYMFVKSYTVTHPVYDSIIYNCTVYESLQSNGSQRVIN